MDQEKKIKAPRPLWDRIRAMMEREGIGSINEAVRHSMRAACDASEGKGIDT